MTQSELIERDLKEYLNKEHTLSREDRIHFLMSIFSKRFEFAKFDHVVNRFDLIGIINQAKSQYANLRLPVNITKVKIETHELTNLSMVESVLLFLGRHDLLRKTVRLDYTDSSADFESFEDL